MNKNETKWTIPCSQSNYTFDNYVIGDSNNFAASIANEVANTPGGNYNPFFIYGASGLGKTHLLQAIKNEIKKNTPTSLIHYTTAESFSKEFIYTIRHSEDAELIKRFHDKYWTLDVLLIDDVEFFACKNSAQECLFHLFNDLNDANKQIVLTSDRPIKELRYIEDRLTNLFASGIIANILPPSYEMRISILQKKADQYRIPASPTLLMYIAEHEKENIRIMEGMLKTVSYYASVNNLPLDSIATIKEALHEKEPILRNP